MSTIVECVRDEKLAQVLRWAALVTPDGMPTVWLGRAAGYKNIGRVYGPDLMLAICELSERAGYRHYFLGSTEVTLERLSHELCERFPRLKVSGHFSPPFRTMTQDEDDRMVEDIEKASPEILWVGLGSPNQEFWMYEHRPRLNVPVMIGVGAAFDFVSGNKRQAPRWVRAIGMEWLFRLCSEPRRLWRRYLIGNAKFLYYLARERIFRNWGGSLQQNVQARK